MILRRFVSCNFSALALLCLASQKSHRDHFASASDSTKIRGKQFQLGVILYWGSLAGEEDRYQSWRHSPMSKEDLGGLKHGRRGADEMEK
jgi:hypothetical protein